MILFTETVKADMLRRLHRHYEADEITQGHYWKHGKGCAVGCLTHDPRGGHEKFPELFGLPEQFARLIDAVFEGLPSDVAKDWPLHVIEAVPTGAVLDQTFFDGLAIARLHRVLSLQDSWAATDRERVVSSVEGVILALETGEGFDEARLAALSAASSASREAVRPAASAEYAARSASWSAARDSVLFTAAAASAATSAAEYAATSAARTAATAASRSAAEYADTSAAEYTARNAAQDAARYAAWEHEADTIIDHLQTLETDRA